MRPEDPVFLVRKRLPLKYQPNVKGRTIVKIKDSIAKEMANGIVSVNTPSVIRTSRGLYVVISSGEKWDETPALVRRPDDKDLPAKYFHAIVLKVGSIEIRDGKAIVKIIQTRLPKMGSTGGTYELIKKDKKWIMVKGGLRQSWAS